MQNLGLRKTPFEGDSGRAGAQTNVAPQSTVHPPADTARTSPPLAVPLRPFSHKTYHIGQPLVTKPPTLAYTADPNEANELLCMIRGEAIAFDMEWPFSRGKYSTVGKTALIQVGDDRLVILIHLSMMKSEYPYPETFIKAYSMTCAQHPAFPAKLRQMLEEPKIFKLGVNVIGDARKLAKENSIYTQGVLDLSDIARAVDAENCKAWGKIALAKLCAQYIGFELGKGAVRTSNWSKKLSQEQMNCECSPQTGNQKLEQRPWITDAADDVYSTIMIYNSLMHIGKQRGITIDHASLSTNLTRENATVSTVLKEATGVKSNTVKAAKGVAPSKMRAFGYFDMGQSVEEIGKSMRTPDNPLMPNTVR